MIFFKSVIVLIILASIQPVPALRFVKESSQSKSKCQRGNITIQSDRPTSCSKCIALNHPYCLDVKLPYNSTTLPESLPDLNLRSIEEVENYLQRWYGAKKLPKCWPILQTTLCSILMPQCDEDPLTGQISRVSKSNIDLCIDLINKDECKFIGRQIEWPSFMNCNDTNVFARNCTNELRSLKYRSSVTACQYPLVPSNDTSNWFQGIGGCALDCKFPISSRTDQDSINFTIKLCSIFALPCLLYRVVIGFLTTQETDRRTSSIPRVINSIRICQMLIYIGWSLQFIHHGDIACSPSGASLSSPPVIASLCFVTFMLTYPTSLSSLMWCALLGKLCYEELSETAREIPGSNKMVRFHDFLNYGGPLVLSMSVFFLGYIDGHGLYGICTVGQQSMIIKSIFVFVPDALATVYGNYYFLKTIFKISHAKNLSDTLKKKISESFKRISALVTLNTIQVSVSIGIYFYGYANRGRWRESIESFISCSLNLNIDSESDIRRECTIDTMPIIILYYLEIVSRLGVVIASWAMSDYNLKEVRRKLIKCLEVDEENKQCPGSPLNQATNGEMVNMGRIAGQNADAGLDHYTDNPSDSTSINIQSDTSTVNSYTNGSRWKKRFRRAKFKRAREIIEDGRMRNMLLHQQQGPSIAPMTQQEITDKALLEFLQTVHNHHMDIPTVSDQTDVTKRIGFAHGFADMRK